MKLISKNNAPKPVSIAITEELLGALGCAIASSSNDWGEVAISEVVDLSSAVILASAPLRLPSLNLQRENSTREKKGKTGCWLNESEKKRRC